MGISRATSLFILYIGQAAMEIANDNKRKTVKESDVLKALEGKIFITLRVGSSAGFGHLIYGSWPKHGSE